jgi:hypothetical protein
VSHKGQPTGKMQIPAMIDTPLTGPQEKFVQAMAKGLDKAAACREAGYGSRTSAYRALQMPNVAARLRDLQAETAARTRITIDGITERLLAIVDRMEAQGGTVPELNLARRALMDLAKLLEWKGPPPPPALNITEIRRMIVAPDGTVLKTLPTIPRRPPPREA